MNAAQAFSQQRLASALLDPDASCPPGLRAWNGSNPQRRFDVHRNNVVASLVAALADTFPVVQALVGEPFFGAMAALFVRQHPPASPVLAAYGADFPGFIEAYAPAAVLPYLADVARLELARVQAFHAADAAPAGREAAAAALACGERAGALRLLLHPATRLVSSRHAIVSVWAAHQGQGELARLDPFQPEAALVLRPHAEVLVLRCDAGCAAFVQSLQQGLDLGASAAVAALAGAPFDLAATLQLLLAHGALSAIALPPEAA